MSTRRDFLKHSALLGAAASVPFFSAVAEETQIKETVAEQNQYTVLMQQVRKKPSPPRQINIPDTGGFKVLKGDFHIHTLFSDGRVMPHDRVAEAADNGLDVIAITDHVEFYRDYISGKTFPRKDEDHGDDQNVSYTIAKAEADKRNLFLVHGAEITKGMPPGHFNALFLQDTNPVAAVVKDWRAMLQVSVEQGAFLQWNHPGWKSQIPLGKPIHFFPEHEEIFKNGWMHGIEVFNGVCEEYYPAVSDWCNERDLAITSNSDIHESEWSFYGHQNPLRPMTLILAKERTLESVKEAFFAKRTIGYAAGLIFGRDPWLPALFKSCVKLETLPGRIVVTNQSDLPVAAHAGGFVSNVPANESRDIYLSAGVKKLTIANWMIGTNKPLEIEL